MDPDTISKSFTLVWEAFSAAPFSFIAALVLVGMVILLLTRSFYRQQIVTSTVRRELAHVQAQAAQEAQKGLEEEIDRLQTEIRGLKEAIERDAAERDQPVSPSVLEANTATENALENVQAKKNELRRRLYKVFGSPIDPTDWTYGATRLLKGNDENEDNGRMAD